jgi:hypothetical protein
MNPSDTLTAAATDDRTETASSPTTPPFSLPERYQIVRELGRGGFGVVYLAHDTLLGRSVAVKVIAARSAVEAARVRREIGSLRLLHIPGVVAILDDQPLAEGHLLVMEYVVGSPFPGSNAQDTDRLVSRTLRLLDTLGRVHARGVVHRDLKPQNILVGADEEVVILDFGIASGEAVQDEALTHAGSFVGTVRYAAPEQLRGTGGDGRVDLYAVGAMLYELVTGAAPGAHASVAETIRRRLSGDPPPVREATSGVAPRLAALIDRLVACSPANRPRSAAEAAAMLESRGREALAQMPWFGPRRAVESLVEAAVRRTAVQLVGPAGSGRTRTLREAGDALQGRGYTVEWLTRGQRPLSSLRAWLGLTVLPELRMADVAATVADRVQRALDTGVVLVVDEEGVDDHSLAVLRQVRGAVLSAVPRARLEGERVALPTLVSADLEPLFEGPERLLHRRTNAARTVLASGLRHAGLIATALAHAVDRRTATRSADGRFVLGGGFMGSATDASSEAGRVASEIDSLHEARREVLEWVESAWPSTALAQLSTALGRPMWETEGDLEALIRAGLLRAIGGRYEALARAGGTARWTDKRRRACHASLGQILPTGDARRLRHLVAGGAVEAALAEALQVGRDLLARGAGAECRRVLELALSGSLGGTVDTAIALDAARLRAMAAIEEGTTTAFDVALYDVGKIQALHLGVGRGRAHGADATESRRAQCDRAEAFPDGNTADGPRSASARPTTRDASSARQSGPGSSRTDPEDVRIVRLLQSLRRAAQTVDAALLAELDDLGPFDALGLEVGRQAARLRAARVSPPEHLARVVEDLEALRSTRPDARPFIDLLLGQQAYREGRWHVAMALCSRAARCTTSSARAALAWVTAGAAALEAFALDKAIRFAEKGRAAAQRADHNLFEGQAEWLRRTALYRSDAPLTVDHELLAAASVLGHPDLEAQMSFTEAAVAFRSGEFDVAARLSAHVADVWGPTGRVEEATLMRALVYACREGAMSADERADLIARAAGSRVAGFGIQCLGLLRADAGSEAVATQAAQVDRRHWSRRLDVLSVAESLDRLVGR